MQVWVPSIVVLLSVLVAVISISKPRKPPERESFAEILPSVFSSSEELESSLSSAEKLNSYNVLSGGDPGVRLGKALRYVPHEYNSAVAEISTRFREGRVVSIDLNNMNMRQAARLVDFCSGMAAVSHGWIYRITDRVIVITPPG